MFPASLRYDCGIGCMSKKNLNKKRAKYKENSWDKKLKMIAAILAIALTLIGIFEGIFRVSNFLTESKGMVKVIIKNPKEIHNYELAIYQNDYFIKNITTKEIIEIDKGDYELKVKVVWSEKPILLKKFKVFKKQYQELSIELPKRKNALVSGHVKIRREYLDNGANLIVEAIDQNKRTITFDDGAYLLEVEPDISIRIFVKKNTKLIWRTLIVNRVKPGDEIIHNITIPYEKLY